MAKHVYCTYFDDNYLPRGIALYQSLQRYAPGARLWVLCLNDRCYRALLALDLPHLVPCRLADFEAADPEVAATRSTRSTIEYFFTCSPAWMLFVLKREQDADWVTYLDGDLYFYASPELIYQELQGSSVAIIPHRFTRAIGRLKKYGTYNVGWVGVHNEPDGRAVIEWWRKKCIEWCYDYVDGGRFADQGYLDTFPSLSARVRVIDNIGANLAPWNLANYRIDFREDTVFIDDVHPLIFFHFQGVKKGLHWFIFNNHRRYHAPFSSSMREHLYKPYINEVLEIERRTSALLEVPEMKPHGRSSNVGLRKYLEGRVRYLATRFLQVLDVLTGRAFFVYKGVAR
ncbi:hypothetical protein ABIB75_003821 [Bradyrhizobium sp. GM2.2]|uniref:hypothetical protein n=1 Tax=Bradyrhizobium sp. GM2.2 TaxID=3156358 RepID=UPI0033922506